MLAGKELALRLIYILQTGNAVFALVLLMDNELFVQTLGRNFLGLSLTELEYTKTQLKEALLTQYFNILVRLTRK